MKPKYCKLKRHSDRKPMCCYCKNKDFVFQEGDGNTIHSLCRKCYERFILKKDTKVVIYNLIHKESE